MSFTQLNPTIPMECPKGAGHAIGVIDYSQEHHLIWIIALDKSGEIWGYPNPLVRMQTNFSIQRTTEKLVSIETKEPYFEKDAYYHGCL